MFRTTGIFSEVPCPLYLLDPPSICSIPNCLFSHDTPSSSPSSTSSPLPSSSSSSTRAVVQDEEGQIVKRRKLDNNDEKKTESGITTLKDGSSVGPSQRRIAGSAPLIKPSPKLKRASPTVPRSVLVKPPTKPISTPPTSTSTPSAPPASTVKRPAPIPQRALKATELLPRAVPSQPERYGTRLQLLRLLHTEYARLYQVPETDPLLMELSLREEEKAATEKQKAYSSSMKLRIFALKKKKPEEWIKEREAFEASKKRVAGGKDNDEKQKEKENLKEGQTSTSTTPIVKPPSKEEKNPSTFRLDTGLTEEAELARLEDLIHTPEALAKSGFLLEPPSYIEIEAARRGMESSDGYEVCDRCSSRFKILPKPNSSGAITHPTSCRYHWGRAFFPSTTTGYTQIDRAVNEKIYNCCQTPLGQTAGCTTAPTHVFNTKSKSRLALTLPFLDSSSSPLTALPAPTKERAFSLDCEMAYTTHGLELVRVTLLSFPSHRPALDALVLPIGQILNHNTRFSGVTRQMYANSTPYSLHNRYPPTPSGPLPCISSPSAARDTLLRDFISPTTILTGHALENDLLALRLIHPRIVDTAILFPHRRGPPVKNKLKFLVERHLGMRIQEDEKGSVETGVEDDEGGGAQGHDSFLDARCAAELVRLRLKEPKKVGTVRKRVREEGVKESLGGMVARLKAEVKVEKEMKEVKEVEKEVEMKGDLSKVEVEELKAVEKEAETVEVSNPEMIELD